MIIYVCVALFYNRCIIKNAGTSGFERVRNDGLPQSNGSQIGMKQGDGTMEVEIRAYTSSDCPQAAAL